MRRNLLAGLALAVLLGGACASDGAAPSFKAQEVPGPAAIDDDAPSGFEVSKALRSNPADDSVEASYNPVTDPMSKHVVTVVP